MFGTTTHLNLRAYRESDRESLLAMENDPDVARTASLAYVVPHGPGRMKKFEEVMEGALMFVVFEAKPEFAGMRKDVKADSDSPGAEDHNTNTDLFVGYCVLFLRNPKNRDPHLGISITPCWWGNGFGTEAVRWVVDYAFEQLDMHRVSLGLLGSNERALKLYKKVGFVEEGRKRGAIFQDRKWVDDVSMGILVDDWEMKRRQ